MTTHILDRPVWSALYGRQAHHAIGDQLARKYNSDIAPFIASRDNEPQSLEAMAALIPQKGKLILLQADEVALPPNAAIVEQTQGVQMIARDVPAFLNSDTSMEPLGFDDAPEMLALANLTKPGPFTERTSTLGDFWGVREKGKLVAMAGERMKQEGYVEVSGVCTHPDFRGRGYAKSLSLKVAAAIARRGETPYLHAFATNTAAISLYESIGFELRCAVNVAFVERNQVVT